MRQYETVIGLEVHVELATRTKIFCGCSTAFGAAPNTHTCPVCTGMPGALPVLNRQVVDYAMAVGLALGCDITRTCRFDRKNYFYPDNPQNYQITQLYTPLCRNGQLEIETAVGRKSVGIHEIHMEEDAGKLLHDEAGTLIDFNRSGVPLIEIVTEPDMGSAEEVITFLDKLRLMIQYLGASDCKLQEGSMRVDVNLSVRESGTAMLGTRTEMKNLNSFKAISRAVESERQRQIALLEAGEEVVQETRRWDDDQGLSYAMRSKEDAKDYRYFPEPDLLALQIEEDWIRRLQEAQPEFREEKLVRYQMEYGLPAYDADILTGQKSAADLFEAAAALCGKPKKVSNWLMGEGMRLLKETGTDAFRISPAHLAALVELVEEGRITGATAKEVFEVLFREDADPAAYVAEHGLEVLRDEEALRRAVEEAIVQNPKSVADYKAGKTKAAGYLVGQVMKAMKGQAAPDRVKALVEEELERS